MRFGDRKSKLGDRRRSDDGGGAANWETKTAEANYWKDGWKSNQSLRERSGSADRAWQSTNTGRRKRWV